MMTRVLRVAQRSHRRRRDDVFGSPPPLGWRGPAPSARLHGATANHCGDTVSSWRVPAWPDRPAWPAALPEFPTNP